MDRDKKVNNNEHHYLMPCDENNLSSVFPVIRQENQLDMLLKIPMLDDRDCFGFSEKLQEMKRILKEQHPLRNWYITFNLIHVRRMDPAFLNTLLQEIRALRNSDCSAYCWNLNSTNVLELFNTGGYTHDYVLLGAAGPIRLADEINKTNYQMRKK